MTLSSLTSLNVLEGKQIGSKSVVMIVEYLTVNQVENCSVATHQIVKIVKKTINSFSTFKLPTLLWRNVDWVLDYYRWPHDQRVVD